LHALVLSQLQGIHPINTAEREQWLNALAWVESGAPLCRVAKPATPPKHLVSYFPVVDDQHVLLVDHKNARLWLPTGGHVEEGEDPRATVVRELKEELGLSVQLSELRNPLMVTVTQTVGLTSGHTDVSLWYPVMRSRSEPIEFDQSEFNQVRWFHFSEVPHDRTDPNLEHFLAKLRAEA
jgi:8-oxo-dGTP pyrophosphatase MutT (NUDIX family)